MLLPGEDDEAMMRPESVADWSAHGWQTRHTGSCGRLPIASMG